MRLVFLMVILNSEWLPHRFTTQCPNAVQGVIIHPFIMAELLCCGLNDYIHAFNLAIMELVILKQVTAAHKLQGSGRLK